MGNNAYIGGTGGSGGSGRGPIFDETQFQLGVGTRGVRSFNELTKFNVKNVYIGCLRCLETWILPKTEWDLNMPVICPHCLGQSLSHEYCIANATPSVFRRNNDGIIVKQPINEAYKRAVIKRVVTVQSII